MKIIAGTARGVDLTNPAGMEIRPTSVRARKALFDSLGDISALAVLDLKFTICLLIAGIILVVGTGIMRSLLKESYVTLYLSVV